MFAHRAKQLRHNMRASTSDATSFGLMVGIGETYLPAFALAVGLGEVTAGLVGSLPLAVGGVLQGVSPWILRRGVSEQAWVVGASVLQTVAFAPLIAAALYGQISALALLLCASIYWGGGLASGPAWNSWIEKLIPRSIRANYFAARTRAAQIATAFGFMAAGLLLQWSRTYGAEVQAFAGLFTIAMLARVYSVVMLAVHRAPTHTRTVGIGPTSKEEAAYDRSSGIGERNLIVYLVLVQGMVQISGPYFTPYMLRHLDLSYIAYAGLIAIAFLAKIIALGTWGRLAAKRGAEWLLLLGGAMILPLATFWIVSENYLWLLFIQAVNGFAWAAYELGFFLMLFESVPIRRRVRMLTIYNMANTLAWCGGALIGGLLLKQLGSNPSGYYTLFVVSSVGRCFAYAYLLSHRPHVFVAVRDIGFRILGIRTNASVLETPILSSLDDHHLEDSKH